jgi:hypothetical protein
MQNIKGILVSLTYHGRVLKFGQIVHLFLQRFVMYRHRTESVNRCADFVRLL